MDTHETVGSLRSLVFWAVLGIAATVSASWIQSSPDRAGGTQVAQQQVVPPQFPAQAQGSGGVATAPPQVVNPQQGPQYVMPRPIPGQPGPPPTAERAPAVTQAPAEAVAAPRMNYQRRGVPPPYYGQPAGEMRPALPPAVAQPAQQQSAPVQTAIPFSSR